MTAEYDNAVAETIQSERAQQARLGFYVASDTNADAYAEARRVARRTGVPVDTALNSTAEIKKQDAMQSVDFERLAKVAPATASLLADAEQARLAHDDIENLGLIETLVNSFKRGWPSLKSVGPAIQVASQANDLGLYQQIDQRIAAGESPRFVLADYRDYRLSPLFARQEAQILANWQAFKDQHLTDTQANFADSTTRLAALQKQRHDIPLPRVVDQVLSEKTWGGALSGIASDPLKFIAAIGPESLVQSLPGLLAAVPAGIAAGPWGVASTMGINSFIVDWAGSLIGAMQDAGIDTTDPETIRAGLKDPKTLARIAEQASKHATVVAGFDALSGGVAGKMLLPSPIAGKLSKQLFAKEMANIALQAPIQGMLGGAGELGGQLYAGQEIKPGEVLAEVFGEFFGTPAEVVSASAKRLHQNLKKVQQAEEAAAVLAEINDAASASKVRTRDTETFEAFVAQAAEEGPVNHIYIDAQTLMQSGVVEQVAAVSPAVAQQFQSALESGGQIQIPVGEYAAHIAPTEYAQNLADHLKTDPDGLTPAEKQEYMQTQVEQLQQEVEEALTEKQEEAAFRQSVETVHQTLKTQLDTTQRFTHAVNDAYASMVSQFYAVMASRLGMKPETVYQHYPLKVQAESVVSDQQLTQEAIEKAQQGIRRIVERAKEPGNQSSKAEISPVQPWLVEAAHNVGLEIAQYTHALDTSAVKHVMKNHSDVKAEKSRGQLAVTETDFAMIPEIISHPDKVIFGTQNRLGKDQIVYLKALPDGSTVYLEEVRTKRKELALQSMRRYPATISAESILSTLDPNAQDDSRSTLIIVDRARHSHSSYEQVARGAYSPDQLTISLLKNADLSTFLHETGHFFLETLIDFASRTDVPTEIQQDINTAFKWLGVQGLKTWNSLSFEAKRPFHEQFARGFEAYLFEGRAPSSEMQTLFQRFRAWLLNVYQQISNLNAELTDEVRGVFDRLLATDEQIALREQERNLMSLFASSEQAGMTPEEFTAYQSLGAQATHEAAQELQARGLRDMQWLHNARSRELKKLQKQAKEVRAGVRASVEAEVMRQPIYKAWQFLTAKSSEAVPAAKLSLKGLHDLYRGEKDPYALFDWKRLRDLRMVNEEGIHPDAVAELFGLTSGDELVRKLVAADKPSVEIDALTDLRMLEQYGDLVTPEAIERAADQAIHNGARLRMVATEANALAQATGQKKILAEAARHYAKAMIDRCKIRDLRPGQYAHAQARAARAAHQAMKSAQLAVAALEKRKQLIQGHAARAAYHAQDEVEAGLRYLRKFDGENTTLDVDYREQIEALLERFDLRKGQSLAAIDKKQTLAKWIESQREQGLEPDIPEALENEAYRTSYKNMTLESFRGLVDSVKQIEHLGRLKKRLLTARKQRDYAAARDEMVASIQEHAGERIAQTRSATTHKGRVLEQAKGFTAAHVKAATWARILDGGRDGGPMWEYFVRNANACSAKETTMRAEATAALIKILEPVLKQGKMGGKGQYFPSIRRSLNRETILAIALNLGNESNIQRLLGGENWTLQQILPALQTLTEKELLAVQAIWDHFESYRPMIAEKERRVFGKEPEWIELKAISLTSAEGKTVQLRGGYYPIQYDARASMHAQQHDDAQSAKEALLGAHNAVTTRRSFTKARVDEVTGRPLLLTTSGLYKGLNEVIHDLSWHEWLIDANRLLRSNRIDQAIRHAYGPEVIKQFKTWRDDIAVGASQMNNAIESALKVVRQNVAMTGLGYNLITALQQPLGITLSVVRIGKEWALKGLGQYFSAPIARTQEVQAKSEFMRNRVRTRFRELNELRNRVQGSNTVRESIIGNAFVLMTHMQTTVDIPTWLGAYEKAVCEENAEERAIALADQAVIDSQGDGATHNLAAVERGGPATKLFTVFYAYMNTTLNTLVASGMSEKKASRKAADFLMATIIPASLTVLLKDALTPSAESEDCTLCKKLLKENLEFFFGLFVLGREIAEAASTMAGVGDHFGYHGPAGLRPINDTLEFAAQLRKSLDEGQPTAGLTRTTINFVGGMTGLPSAQINRTVKGTKALAEGDTANPLAIGFGYNAKK